MKPLIIASTLALALLAQYLLGCTDIYIYDVPVYLGTFFWYYGTTWLYGIN